VARRRKEETRQTTGQLLPLTYTCAHFTVSIHCCRRYQATRLSTPPTPVRGAKSSVHSFYLIFVNYLAGFSTVPHERFIAINSAPSRTKHGTWKTLLPLWRANLTALSLQ